MKVLTEIENILWSRMGIFALAVCGGYFTFVLRGYQFRGFTRMLRAPLGGGRGESGTFTATCTAVAASVGVGNIAGVAAAICAGGAGAVFWMWVSAALGMMTSFAENLLGGIYRGADGSAGAMYYLKNGVGGMTGRILAAVFSFFCILSSLGIGNISQAGAITENLLPAVGFIVPERYSRLFLGVLLAAVVGLVLRGGNVSAGRISALLVPLMALLYIGGSLICILSHVDLLAPAIGCIVRTAFHPSAALSGGILCVVSVGFRRGLFSSEAGMGSAVAVNCASRGEAIEHAHMGMFEVFFDTGIICTLTALVILTSGRADLSRGVLTATGNPMTLVNECFFVTLGNFGSVAVCACTVLFAFTSVIGWSCCGTAAWSYLFKGGSKIYYVVYPACAFLGALASPSLVFCLSDIFNALMLLPNTAGLLILRKKVVEKTKAEGL